MYIGDLSFNAAAAYVKTLVIDMNSCGKPAQRQVNVCFALHRLLWYISCLRKIGTMFLCTVLVRTCKNIIMSQYCWLGGVLMSYDVIYSILDLLGM